jgi:hypothetical protein
MGEVRLLDESKRSGVLYSNYVSAALSPSVSAGATHFSVAQPLMAVSQKPLCQPAATLHKNPILRDPYLGLSQVPNQGEPESEPEQFIEKQWFTEAKKANPAKSLKTKDRVWARFFC